MISAAPDASDMPLLGEVLAVELANTLYVGATGTVDWLTRPGLITSWLSHAEAAADLDPHYPLQAKHAEALRQIRDAVHLLLVAATAGLPDIPAGPVATLNHYAAQASCRPQLTWADGDVPSASLVHSGAAADVLIARLAHECIEFLAGPDLGLLRRCEGPGCPMLFVQRHHKRRYCYAGCASRARQTRYYHRSKSSTRRPMPA